jgi:hypothetical protein
MSDRIQSSEISVCLGWVAFAAAGGILAAGSTGAPAILGALASGISLNAATTGVQGFVERFLARGDELAIGHRLDQNRHVAKALRQAQLAGLKNLFLEWRSYEEKPRDEIGDFLKRANNWIKEEIGAAAKNLFRGDPAHQAALQKAFSSALAQKADGKGNVDLRRAAEDALLAELEAQLGRVPITLVDAFRADNGWYSRFALEGAVHLRNNKEVHAIWVAMRQALLGENVEAANAKLDAVLGLLVRLDEALFGRTPIILTLPKLDKTLAKDRFSYLNPEIPFVGREAELASLDDFLESAPKFSWHVIAAGGGAGKSRLAYELCRRREGGWHVGFAKGDANKNLTTGDLANWNPQKPHLIVIDYVLANAELTRLLLSNCAPKIDRFDKNVRILLIERDDDAFQQAQLLSGTDSKIEIEAARWHPQALALGELNADDIYGLVHPFLGQAQIDQAAFTLRHHEIDPERRVLTALMLAEHFAQGGSNFSGLTDILKALVDRERKLWAAAGIRADVEEPLLALATIADGYSPKRDAALLPPDFANAIETEAGEKGIGALAHFAPPSSGEKAVGRLLPDILGEFFALETLAATSNATGKPRFGWLAEAAWRADPNATLDFAYRARRDFPNHIGLDRIYAPVHGIADSYFAAALSAGTQATNIDGFAAAAFARVAIEADPAAQLAEARLFLMFTGSSETSVSAQILGPALARLTQAATAPNADPQLAVEWAKSVFNVVTRTAAQDPAGARALLERLDRRAAAPNADPQLAVSWAKGVTNVIGDTAAQDPTGARALLENLDRRAAAANADPQLAVEWAKSVFNFVAHTSAQDPDGARALLDSLDRRAAAPNADPQLAVSWAKSVFNFITDTAAQDPDGARALLDSLDRRAAAPNADPQLAVIWAESVTNFIGDTAAQDPNGARALLESLDRRAAAPNADPQLVVEWAKSATNFIGKTAAQDPDGARALVARQNQLGERFLDNSEFQNALFRSNLWLGEEYSSQGLEDLAAEHLVRAFKISTEFMRHGWPVDTLMQEHLSPLASFFGDTNADAQTLDFSLSNPEAQRSAAQQYLDFLRAQETDDGTS